MMGGKKKYINIFGSFTEPFNSKKPSITSVHLKHLYVAAERGSVTLYNNTTIDRSTD